MPIDLGGCVDDAELCFELFVNSETDQILSQKKDDKVCINHRIFANCDALHNRYNQLDALLLGHTCFNND